MRILVNYIYHKNADRFEIQNGPHVYADMKIAVLETEMSIKEPLVVPINNLMTVVDKATYMINHKKFNFVVDEKTGKLTEVPYPAHIEMWLPKDTPVDKLVYKDGKILLVEEETPTTEETTEEKQN